MNNNTSPYDVDNRIAENAVKEPADDSLSDFATAEVPSAANEFAASIDNGIAGATVAPSPTINGGDWGFSRNGRGRRSSSIL